MKRLMLSAALAVSMLFVGGEVINTNNKAEAGDWNRSYRHYNNNWGRRGWGNSHYRGRHYSPYGYNNYYRGWGNRGWGNRGYGYGYPGAWGRNGFQYNGRNFSFGIYD